MKKKALAVLCTGLVLAVSLCACTKKVDGPGSEVVSDVPVTSEEESSVPENEYEGEKTFTEIIDGLKSGYAYAVVQINEQDVLLVTDYVYEYADINNAIGADLYVYDETGVPKMVGHVEAGGTAYPLSIAKNALYVCTNHAITAYVVANGELIARENVEEEYDEDEKKTFVYTSADGASNLSPEEIQNIMNQMYIDYNEGEIIAFDVIGE